MGSGTSLAALDGGDLSSLIRVTVDAKSLGGWFG